MLAAIVFLSAIPGLAANKAPCSDPNDPYHCPQNFYPTPLALAQPGPDLVAKVGAASRAIEDEQTSAKNWERARASWLSAQVALKNAPSSEKESRQSKYDNALVEYRDAAKDLAEKRRTTDKATRGAIAAVGGAYHLTPLITQFPDQGGLAEKLSPWNPTFSRAEVVDSVTGRPRMRKPEEITEENDEARQRAQRTTIQQVGAASGATGPADGRVQVYQQAFKSPEELAATIYHETFHWFDVMSQGPFDAKRELTPEVKFATEAAAYEHEAEFYRALGKLEEFKRRKAVADQYAHQLDVVRQLKQGERGHAVTWTEIKLNDTFRDWIGVDAALHATGPLDDRAANFDVDAETLKEIHVGAVTLDESVRQEGIQRRAEAQKPVSEGEWRRNVHAAAAAEAARCGLELSNSWLVEFQSRGIDPPVRLHPQYHDPASFKASLLLIYACGTQADVPPCNDAVDTMAANWGNAEFRKSLYLLNDSNGALSYCVADLVNNVESPRTYADLKKEVRRYFDRQSQPAAPAPSQPQGNDPPSAPRTPRERDDPPRPGQNIPDCIRQPGGRCIHW